MTIDKNRVIASNRFGFGARPGDLVRIGNEPRQWLRQQLQSPQKLSSTFHGSRKAIQNFLDFRDLKREQIQNGDARAGDVADVMNMAESMRPIYMEDVMARTVQVVETRAPFFERLVHFWSNHFSVSADSPQLFGLAGSLEFEAIRPNVTGRFIDMLMAVEKHPAMLTYLDNFQSVGPNSTLAKTAGRRKVKRKFDINENLAREILELHTLGVDGGYSQADVTTFARAITGWSFGGLFDKRMDRGRPGEFAFNPLIHEPGAKTVLNRRYSQSGIQQGESILRDLALHPATARHLAGKLARHFIADEPAPGAIETLSTAYLQSGGSLPAMYEALIDLDDVWQEAFSKYKSPSDYVYSVFRTINFVPEKPQQVIGPLSMLGQAPFRPGSPAGWPDTAAAWSGGEALFKRVEFAVAVAERVGNRVDPLPLSELVLGDSLGETSRREISRAESGAQGLAMLFASPEFQRR